MNTTPSIYLIKVKNIDTKAHSLIWIQPLAFFLGVISTLFTIQIPCNQCLKHQTSILNHFMILLIALLLCLTIMGLVRYFILKSIAIKILILIWTHVLSEGHQDIFLNCFLKCSIKIMPIDIYCVIFLWRPLDHPL